MKSIKIILLFVSFGIGLTSCFELESESFDTINSNIFPVSDADAIALVTANYNAFQSGGWGPIFGTASSGYFVISEMTTDMGICKWDDGGSWARMYNLNWNPNTGEVTNSFYKYQEISKFTVNMDRISQMDMKDKNLQKRLIAELQCARGIMAYVLYDFYGPIPVATLEELKDPLGDIQIPKLTEEEMFTFIETNLKDAASTLPYSYGQDNQGRFTKGAANTVLMKLYLAYKRWDQAVQIGKELMKPEYGYTLMPNYADIFKLENEGNSEVIHAATCDLTTNSQIWQSHVLPGNYPTNNPAVAKWGGYRMRWQFADSFEPTDKRLEVIAKEYVSTQGNIVKRDGTYSSDGTKISSVSEIDWGAVPIKYGEDPATTGYASSIDFIIYRFADVILMLSEATTRQSNSISSEAVDLLNMIRQRAGLSAKSVADFTSVNSLLDAILMERGHELWYEGSRRTDLIRYGKFIQSAKDKGSVTVKDWFTRFPIPQSIINESKGKIIQNNGY